MGSPDGRAHAYGDRIRVNFNPKIESAWDTNYNIKTDLVGSKTYIEKSLDFSIENAGNKSTPKLIDYTISFRDLNDTLYGIEKKIKKHNLFCHCKDCR